MKRTGCGLSAWELDMSKRLTLVIALVEATVLLVMKYASWYQGKQQKPAASKAYRAAGHRVVKPSPPAYNDALPQGETDAAYLPTSSGPADKKIHKED